MESVESIGMGTKWGEYVAVAGNLWEVLGEYEREVVGEWVGFVFIKREIRAYEVMIGSALGFDIALSWIPSMKRFRCISVIPVEDRKSTRLNSSHWE